MSHEIHGCLPGSKPCSICRAKRQAPPIISTGKMEQRIADEKSAHELARARLIPVVIKAECLYDVSGWCARYGHAQQIEPWKCPGRLYTSTAPSTE